MLKEGGGAKNPASQPRVDERLLWMLKASLEMAKSRGKCVTFRSKMPYGGFSLWWVAV